MNGSSRAGRERIKAPPTFNFWGVLTPRSSYVASVRLLSGGPDEPNIEIGASAARDKLLKLSCSLSPLRSSLGAVGLVTRGTGAEQWPGSYEYSERHLFGIPAARLPNCHCD